MRCMMKPGVAVVLMHVMIACALAQPPVPAAPGGVAAPAEGERVPGQPWVRHVTTDALARRITFYLSESSRAGDPLPLIVYVHGSGSQSIFTKVGERIVGCAGQSSVLDVAAGRAHVLIVEKPGVAFLDSPKSPGGASEASEEFRREHTLERWAEAVSAAMRAATYLPTVDRSKTLVIGHSEGGLVACKVARDNPLVTHVATLAGGGPSQLYDLVELARRGDFFNVPGADAQRRVDLLLGQWNEVIADPDSAERLFLGHPHRRWSSFLASSPMDQLAMFGGEIFIGQGSADKAVLPESAELLRIELLAHGKRSTFKLIEGADHSFSRVSEDGKRVDGWTPMMRDVVDWFVGAPQAERR